MKWGRIFPGILNALEDAVTSFDPNQKNKLLAILPGNRIATFEDFESIDINKLKTSKKHLFQMRIREKAIENLSALAEHVQQP